VASEVRSLAQHTQARTKEIKTILDSLAIELAPVHDALQTSGQLVDVTADGVRKVGAALGKGHRWGIALCAWNVADDQPIPGA